MHGALRARMCLNNASTKTVRKCLKRNNGHLTTLQIWMEWRYHVWGLPHCAASSNPKVKILELTQKQVGQYFATISSSSSLKELSCFRAVELNQPAYPISVSLVTIHCLYAVVLGLYLIGSCVYLYLCFGYKSGRVWWTDRQRKRQTDGSVITSSHCVCIAYWCPIIIIKLLCFLFILTVTGNHSGVLRRCWRFVSYRVTDWQDAIDFRLVIEFEFKHH